MTMSISGSVHGSLESRPVVKFAAETHTLFRHFEGTSLSFSEECDFRSRKKFAVETHTFVSPLLGEKRHPKEPLSSDHPGR